MTKRLPILLTLLIITLLSVGFVESIYQGLEYLMARNQESLTRQHITRQQQETPQRSQLPPNRRDYNIIVSRNLFGSKPESQVEKGTDEKDPPFVIKPTSLNVILMGTIVGEDITTKAIILDRKTKQQELYQVGDDVEGALVKEIKRGEVILVVNGHDEMLDMSEAASVRSAPNQAAAPVQQAQAISRTRTHRFRPTQRFIPNSRTRTPSEQRQYTDGRQITLQERAGKIRRSQTLQEKSLQ